MRRKDVARFTSGAACAWPVRMLADIRNVKEERALKACPELLRWVRPLSWRAKRWTNDPTMTIDFAIDLKRRYRRRLQISSSMVIAFGDCLICRIFRSASSKGKDC